MNPSSSPTTRSRLQYAALRLFREQGYDATSVAEISRSVGVSHMTFFRHFPTKESVVVGDLFDPVIADAVAGQPQEHRPLERAVHGLVSALEQDVARAELTSAAFRHRIELISRTPALRGAAWSATHDTETAIAGALAAGGASQMSARAAAAAVLGAATTVLLEWAAGPGYAHAADALREGLLSLVEAEP